MIKKITIQTFLLLLVSVSIGFVIVVQFRSFQKVEQLRRERPENIFQQIETFQLVSNRLRKENEEIAQKITSSLTEVSRLQAITNELGELHLLAGEMDIQGPGVQIVLPKAPETFWLVDLINQMSRNGAEALAINDIRWLPNTVGLRSFPSGELLYGRFFLSPPITLSAIGDQAALDSYFHQAGNILSLIEKKFPKDEVKFQSFPLVKIPAFRD